MKNNHALSLMCFQMLESGANRRTVKRALTSRRVKGRQAVVLLCKQEMALLRSGKLRLSENG
ncbi:MAG: hypothetical protein RR184_08950 [Citrobacter sp.]|jgi:hypothetical protein|uniref:Uncharacterized protein n=1 Tax=Citrobacter tructae TaxID=2562449 RepID=A0ABX5SZL1_9ENTR|nr:hypothetical protein [Citrobacter tructae]QBX79627.1 hypothetical protein E4Z61_04335 [Citrobacter tructae]